MSYMHKHCLVVLMSFPDKRPKLSTKDFMLILDAAAIALVLSELAKFLKTLNFFIVRYCLSKHKLFIFVLNHPNFGY